MGRFAFASTPLQGQQGEGIQLDDESPKQCIEHAYAQIVGLIQAHVRQRLAQEFNCAIHPLAGETRCPFQVLDAL